MMEKGEIFYLGADGEIGDGKAGGMTPLYSLRVCLFVILRIDDQQIGAGRNGHQVFGNMAQRSGVFHVRENISRLNLQFIVCHVHDFPSVIGKGIADAPARMIERKGFNQTPLMFFLPSDK